MASMNYVGINNYGIGFVIGAKGGIAKHVTITNDMRTGTKIRVCTKDVEYDAGAQRTPIAFQYAASLLHSYTKAYGDEPDKYSDRVLVILPDDAAVRSFEIKRLCTELEDLDAVIARATKPWMGEEWQEAIAAWATAYVDALGEGLSVGTMKKTNIHRFEVRTDALGSDPLTNGQSIQIKNGKVLGLDYSCENNKITGTYEVSVMPGRTFVDDKGETKFIPERYFIRRGSTNPAIKNLQKASSLLRDALPHLGEAEVVEASAAAF